MLTAYPAQDDNSAVRQDSQPIKILSSPRMGESSSTSSDANLMT